jgi:hypothetical protein
MVKINLSNKMRRLFIRLGAAFFVLTGLAALASGALPVQADDNQYVSWTEYTANPVFDPIEKTYYPSILFDGTTYHMWYDNGTTTSYTTSPDGINWNGVVPTIGLPNAHHPHVEYIGDQYMIWYWDSPITYLIANMRCAVSSDGITWEQSKPLTQVGTTVVTGASTDWNYGTYGPIDVFYDASKSATTITDPVDAASVWNNRFVMYYDGATGNTEDIGLAVSNDGINWQGYLDGAEPVLAHSNGIAWDANYTTFGTVLKIDGTYHLWYSGGISASNAGIGYATSTDGINWSKSDSNPIMSKSNGVPWRSARTYTPTVLYNAGNFNGHGDANPLKMWYTGLDSGDNYAIGYASANTQSWLLDNKTILTGGKSRWDLDYMTTPTGGSLSSTNPFVMSQTSIIWMADQPAGADVTFHAGDWKAVLATSDWSAKSSAEVGDYNPGTGIFTAFPATSTVGYSGVITITLTTGAGTINQNDYLALKINNDSGTSQTIITGKNSYLDSPPSTPDYPLPEMAAGILLTLGLAGLVGFMVVRRRQIRKAERAT